VVVMMVDHAAGMLHRATYLRIRGRNTHLQVHALAQEQVCVSIIGLNKLGPRVIEV